MTESFFGKEKISKIIIKLAPPVMLATLIQGLYNIVDSFFVGRFSESGLTALSIVFPIQLLILAFAVGSGVGVNTAISYSMGLKDEEGAKRASGVATPIALTLYVIFALAAYFLMPVYARLQTKSLEVINDVIHYGRITSVCSVFLFLESVWTKTIQARGDMKTPMFAQITAALINIVLDPLLIFGMWGLPRLGISGAAIATVSAQAVASLIVLKKGFYKSPNIKYYPMELKRIAHLAIPNILMQMAFTIYIFGFNMILSNFSDAAVTTLGIYYKWQTFFFIPLTALETCCVPIIGYNYSAGKYDRVKETMHVSILYGGALMLIGTIVFILAPRALISVFSHDPSVLDIGNIGYRIIGLSFIPQVTAIMYPTFFQAVGKGGRSTILTIVRNILLFVPLGYAFSLIGLNYFWLTYPITEILTSIVGIILYQGFMKKITNKAQTMPIIEEKKEE